MPRGRREGEAVGPYRMVLVGGTGLMAVRVKAGYTQAELAALAGVSERTVRTMETVMPRTRRVRWTLERLTAICRQKKAAG